MQLTSAWHNAKEEAARQLRETNPPDISVSCVRACVLGQKFTTPTHRVGDSLVSLIMATASLLSKLRVPVIGAPLFIVSNPKLVVAQCSAGIVGSFPALNARPKEKLDEWLTEIKERLADVEGAAPFAVNQIVHKSNDRLMHDMELIVKHEVPVVITSLGAREDVNAAVHSYGGIVLHDVINNFFARKAIEKGADGLIAVAA